VTGQVAVLGIFREILASDTARFAMLSGQLVSDIGGLALVLGLAPPRETDSLVDGLHIDIID
jgi:hypothetical protein